MKKQTVLALAAILSILLTGCAEKNAAAPELLTPVGAKMDTAVCAVGDMEDTEVYEGAVAPRSTELFFPSDSRIGAIPVRVGQAVKKGDPLVQIDVSAINSALSALDAEEAEIKKTADYEKKLYDIDVEIASLKLSQATDEAEKYDRQTDIDLRELEYQNAVAARDERLTAIQAERAAYEKQLEDTWLTAPTDGRVAAIACSVGQTVGAYDTVCVVTSDAELILQSDYVSPSALEGAVECYALIAGARYEITPEPVDEDEYARAALKGIKYLSSYGIESADGLTPGETAAVVLVTTSKESALMVPINALFEDGDAYYVYAVEGEIRTRRDVEVGIVTSTQAEILSGLSEGEVVYVGD
jgi:multidrug efflux pump subunit AcrA (membrane-fusion protein)